MPKYSHFFFCLFLLFTSQIFSQKKTLNSKFTTEKIVVDGKFDEEAWQTAEAAVDFLTIFPDKGKPEDSLRKTEVRIVYDNTAVYVAAKLYDNEPNKILKELTSMRIRIISNSQQRGEAKSPNSFALASSWCGPKDD